MVVVVDQKMVAEDLDEPSEKERESKRESNHFIQKEMDLREKTENMEIH